MTQRVRDVSDLKGVTKTRHYRGTLAPGPIAARFFDRLCRQVEVDLGGRLELTRVQTELIRAFAGAATTLTYLNEQVMRGEIAEIDLNAYATVASVMLRIGPLRTRAQGSTGRAAIARRHLG